MSTLKEEEESSFSLYPQYVAQSPAHSRDSASARSMSEWKSGGREGKDPISHDGQGYHGYSYGRLAFSP